MTALLPPGTSAVVHRQATPEPERPLPTDPVAWVREHDGYLWSKQREVARSVVENRVTLVPACHSSGKTYLAAEVVGYWLAAHRGESRAVTTAPSDDQVQGLLWHEIGRVHRAAGLEGRVTLDARWYVGPRGAEELVAWGRKPQDRNDVEQAMTSFQGAHARYLLVVLDEATGIPPWLWNAADSLASNENARILAIGNPDDPTSEFAARCDASTGSIHPAGERYVTQAGAHVIPIDAYQTPNFTGEHVPEYLHEMLVARSYAESMIAMHGEDNPLVVAKVRGLFPDRSSRNVISPALIGAAHRRELPGMGRGQFGLDVSRSVHGDENALYRDRDGVLRLVKAWREPDTTKTTAVVFRETAHTPETPIVVDTDGVGGPVYDTLRRGRPELGAGIGQPRRCIPFSVNTPPRRPRDFDTRRSEIWWSARDELIAGLWDLDPADETLAAQLAAPRWNVDHRGRIHVETKEELAKRGVSSPDRADSVLMARFKRPPIGASQGYPPNGKANGRRSPSSLTSDLRERRF